MKLAGIVCLLLLFGLLFKAGGGCHSLPSQAGGSAVGMSSLRQDLRSFNDQTIVEAR
jgi:hypothetical protein